MGTTYYNNAKFKVVIKSCLETANILMELADKRKLKPPAFISLKEPKNIEYYSRPKENIPDLKREDFQDYTNWKKLPLIETLKN